MRRVTAPCPWFSLAFAPLLALPAVGRGAEPSIVIDGVLIDGERTLVTNGSDAITTPAGPHRLEFFFSDRTVGDPGSFRYRCVLQGADDVWNDAAGGMSLTVQFLSGSGQILSEQPFDVSGTSPDWTPRPDKNRGVERREPVVTPAGAARLRIVFSSGPHETTGVCAIDDLTVNAPMGGLSRHDDLLRNSGFREGAGMGEPTGTPTGWIRGGDDPSIARIMTTLTAPALALVDTRTDAAGEWRTEFPLPADVVAGTTLAISWRQTHRVTPGRQRSAVFLSVPPGDYVFRVAGIATAGVWTGTTTDLRVKVPPRWLDRPWVKPALVSSSVLSLLGVGVLLWRRRVTRHVHLLERRHALEQDRTRIARDMHDDLGAGLTRLTHLAALASRELEHDPEAARRHLESLTGTSGELIHSMEEIVWAVTPTNDSLDHLGDYLCRLAADLFRETPVRLRLAVPAVLPALPVPADVRHNLYLATKEALTNVLRHAGPCEARLGLELEPRLLRITVTDHGCGFVAGPPGNGRGRQHLHWRLEEIGGVCHIETRPGAGTSVTLEWPLPHPAPDVP